MGSLLRKLHKRTGTKPREVYGEMPEPIDIAVIRRGTADFLRKMKETHHRDEYSRVSEAFIKAVGAKYGLPEGWYSE